VKPKEKPVLARRSALAGLLFALTTAVAPAPAVAAGAPTAEEAAAFVARAEAELLALWIKDQRAAWVKANFITEDTEAMAAETLERVLARTAAFAAEAARFDGLALSPDVARKLRLLKTSLPLTAPRDPAKAAELARIAASMESVYGKGEYCSAQRGGECLDLQAISRIMAQSRDPRELLDLWAGWHTISRPLRASYQRFVELANEGATELGFADLGQQWRSGYDMPPDAFSREVDRLWQQVRPLYEALHCHVRAKLAERYGAEVAPPRGPIPAHLLGNMWAQAWSNVYDLVAPPQSGPALDVTRLLRDRGVTPQEMVRHGERFFTSLGFAPLPETFWKRSLFTQPADREVVCHASAWDIDFEDDLRIKMCIEVNDEDFTTIHHELGHNFYQRAYRGLSPLYRDSANDGFHEGIGDTIALSITPEYLLRIGLLDRAPDAGADLGQLMRMALDKVAFLPFGLLVDQYRWKVFSGEIGPEDYNAAWWRLREKYQGVRAPLARDENDFDAGAKYHVPANVPYTRYFLAHILQFQFHRALCQAAGETGPLHRCSIYGNAEAGQRLIRMLEAGRAKPWPDALALLTGQTAMDATAILDYFAPLKKWLDEQNRGRTCGY